ncbi:MAG: hypothetical protein JW940_11240 [Polyangiaceae bacterium]|nr:hypothetical protein [Polyangiaceae bacterium]
MQFRVESDTALNVTSVTAIPEEYDGIPPLSTVSFGAVAQDIHDDRTALACVLLFWRHISGTVSFGKGCSPALATAIEDLFWPRRVRVATVNQKAGALPKRASACLVDDGSFRSFWLEDQVQTQCHLFRILPGASGGSVLTRNETCLQSSLPLLLADADNVSAAIARIGAATLFAQTLYVSTLVVPATRCSPLLEEPQAGTNGAHGAQSLLKRVAHALGTTNLLVDAPLQDELAVHVAAKVDGRFCATTLSRRMGHGLANGQPEEIRWLNLLRAFNDYAAGNSGLDELRTLRADVETLDWRHSAYARTVEWIDQTLRNGCLEELQELLC